jgi:T4 RnlA family RNA ligase
MFTLEEAQFAVLGRTEFAVKELPDTIAYDYIVILEDTFTEQTRLGWIRRNFRGVTFCKHTGKMLSLPFHKFYNVNQNEESRFDIHKDKDATIYEKLDGSMVHFYIKSNGDLVASTCRSPESIQAKEALAFAKANKTLEKAIIDSINDGFTPIFEWVAPHNQIVVVYSNCRLVYLMSRERNTGKYFYEEKYQDKAQKYNFKFSDIFNHVDKHEFEGYVCHLNDDIFKVKTPWYLERHRAVDALMKPLYKLYEVALDGLMDDLIATAPDNHKEKLKAIYSEVQHDILKERVTIDAEFDSIVNSLGGDHASKYTDKDYRKTFVEVAKKGNNFSCMMQLFQGRDPKELISKKLLEKYTQLYPTKLMS